MLKYHFRNSKKTYNPKVKSFVEKSYWKPDMKYMSENIIKSVANIEKSTRTITNEFDQFLMNESGFIKLHEKFNLTRDEASSLRKFRNNEEIIIKPADKGGATVLLDKEFYLREAFRQLNNPKYYKEISGTLRENNISNIREILINLKREGYINDKKYEYFSNFDNVGERTFYLLPKIHKPVDKWPFPHKMPEGRPIISNTVGETYRISEYIESFLAPLANKHESYIKNSYEFVEKIKDTPVPTHALIVTGDISSLYTNMHHDRTINCVEEIFEKYPDPDRPDEYILQLLELTLTNNDFSFYGKNYLQLCGCPMGINFGPSVANLYLLEFDRQAMNGFRIKPELYFRFLDDVSLVFLGSSSDLLEYENFLCNLIPDINIKFEYSTVSNNFLDLTIYKEIIDNNNAILKTKVYFKPTDTHQLLHKDSFHPKHTTNGIVQSQLIRFKRLSSNYSNYLEAAKTLFYSLINRGYTRTELWKRFKYVWFEHIDKNNNTTRNDNTQENNKILPIIVPYNSVGKKLAIAYRNNLSDNTDLHSYKPIVAYTNHKNLRKLLVRSKLLPTDRIVNNSRSINFNRIQNTSTQTSSNSGYFQQCTQPRCLTCKLHSMNTTTFSSTRYKHTHYIKQNITCKTTNIIYLITCRVCNIQYVGETSRSLAVRLTEHRSNIKTNKDTPIGHHFNSVGHNETDIQAIAIEHISSTTDTMDQEDFEAYLDSYCTDMNNRRTREKYWQILLGTIHPQGLNCMRTDINIEH
jgi:hypothetical protein